jgi:AAA ATPase domain
VLVDRDRQLARASAALTRVANSRSSAPSALVLTGARGMGKTVTLGVVAERGRARGFVTAGVAMDSVSDNVQLIATRVAESLKDFESRGGRTAWERVRDRLAALSIEVNAGVVKVTSPPGRDRVATQSASQRSVSTTTRPSAPWSSPPWRSTFAGTSTPQARSWTRRPARRT